MHLEEMGFEIEASHHEGAIGQHEIDFRYVDALDGADKIMTMRLAVKTLAQKNGLHATFMPKPKAGVNGSGMHINLSLEDAAGKNLFEDPSDELGLSRLAYQFMAGILCHIKSMTILTNPLVNSYKRLIPGYDAPVYVAWSPAANRGQLLRIPSSRGSSTRSERRSPDSAMNPYLALAACLAAGLDGIARGMTPPEEIAENIYRMDSAALAARGIQRLPGTLEAAIHALEADPVVTDALGPHVTAQYITGKLREWEEYRTQVSRWELEKYLVTY